MDIAPAMAYETMLRNNINWYNVGEVPQKNLDIAKRTTDRAFWKQLLKESKLGITMNSEQYEKILEDIEKHPVELQYDVAVETFMELYQNREQSFKEGLVKVFKNLSGSFKSHSAFKIQKRTIIKEVFERQYIRSNYNGRVFNDAWKILYLLDGIDPTAIEPNKQPHNIMYSGAKNGQTDFDFGKFRVKVFLGNGNVHLWIEDEELLNKVNRIIAEYYKGMIPKA